MSWNEHVSVVSKSLLKFFGIFNHSKHLASTKVMKQLNFAFVHSGIKYDVDVYGNCTNKVLQKVKLFKIN